MEKLEKGYVEIHRIMSLTEQKASTCVILYPIEI